MAQSVANTIQNKAVHTALPLKNEAVALENAKAARAGQSFSKLSGSDKLDQLPKESLAKMIYYKPQGSSLPRAMAYSANNAGAGSSAATAGGSSASAGFSAAAPGGAVQPANTVYGADGSTKAASMLPQMSEQGATEAYTGCKTCQSRTYQDGSDDAGVSFQTARHIPAATAGISVVSHEGEHVSRETDKAMREDRVVTQKKVTMQMGCCPECHKIYVAGGTTTISTMAAKSDTADAESALSLMGGAGEQVDMEA